MKKTIFVTCAICCLLIYSCSKKAGTDAGSWTFKSQTYHASFVSWVLGTYCGYTGTSFPTGAIQFTFCDTFSNLDRTTPSGFNPPPSMWTIPKGTTYHISSNNPPDSGYVYITMSDTSVKRIYVSRHNESYTVTVTKSADGKKFSLSFPSVELLSNQDGSDSSQLSGTLTQTQ